MNLLKKVFLVLVVVVAIAAAGIYFLPCENKVSNRIEINKPIDVVFAELADFGKWKS